MDEYTLMDQSVRFIIMLFGFQVVFGSCFYAWRWCFLTYLAKRNHVNTGVYKWNLQCLSLPSSDHASRIWVGVMLSFAAWTAIAALSENVLFGLLFTVLYPILVYVMAFVYLIATLFLSAPYNVVVDGKSRSKYVSYMDYSLPGRWIEKHRKRS